MEKIPSWFIIEIVLNEYVKEMEGRDQGMHALSSSDHIIVREALFFKGNVPISVREVYGSFTGDVPNNS